MLVVLQSAAQDGPSNKNADWGGGLIYGKDHAFTVAAPKEWILDNQSGVSQGLHAVFYPEGSNWKDSIITMYINTVQMDENKSWSDFIESDIRSFKAKHADLIVQTGESLATTDDKKRADVRYFTGDQWNNHEAVAYIREQKVVVLIVLSSRNEKAYQTALPNFRELVRSYYFITEDVTIK